MKGLKCLVQLCVLGVFLLGATGAVAEDVERAANLPEVLPQTAEQIEDAEATVPEVEVRDEATDAPAVDLFTSEPEKLEKGSFQCRYIPGCSYVYNPITGCCEEVTGGLCPQGHCL